MTNLATFEATINPEGAVNNIVVCRFNNETKELVRQGKVLP